MKKSRGSIVGTGLGGQFRGYPSNTLPNWTLGSKILKEGVVTEIRSSETQVTRWLQPQTELLKGRGEWGGRGNGGCRGEAEAKSEAEVKWELRSTSGMGQPTNKCTGSSRGATV